MLRCGDTWLLRNRFERREEKLRSRTASGKTIVIPASDPDRERKLGRSHLLCQRVSRNPDQILRLLWGRCPNQTRGYFCSRRRCCSTLTGASFPDSGNVLLKKGEASVENYILKSKHKYAQNKVFSCDKLCVFVHCVVICTL